MELKLVEMDYCDIMLCHGVLGTIIYVIPYIYIIAIGFKELIKNLKNIFIDSKMFYGICNYDFISCCINGWTCVYSTSTSTIFSYYNA